MAYGIEVDSYNCSFGFGVQFAVRANNVRVCMEYTPFESLNHRAVSYPLKSYFRSLDP